MTLHDLIQLAKAHGRASGPGQWGAWLKGVSAFMLEHGHAFHAGDEHNWTDGLMLHVYRHARIPSAQELALEMRDEWDDPVSTWEATCFLDRLTDAAGWGGPPQNPEDFGGDGPQDPALGTCQRCGSEHHAGAITYSGCPDCYEGDGPWSAAELAEFERGVMTVGGDGTTVTLDGREVPHESVDVRPETGHVQIVFGEDTRRLIERMRDSLRTTEGRRD
jgi:hypothetical protein